MNATVGTPQLVVDDDADGRRGWFYRALARGSDETVIAFGASGAENWFPNVGEAVSLHDADAARHDAVILHATLAGCATLADAVAESHRALRAGGLLAVAGYNRLRARATRHIDAPCATLFGFRRALARAGFANVRSFAARPGLDDPVWIVETHRSSARWFYCFEAAARRGSGKTRYPLARSLLAHLHLRAIAEPALIVSAEKC
jgi:hypothetical protein